MRIVNKRYNKDMIKIKRIYDRANPDDGYRILVDRLWPRGVSKAEADIDYWIKDIAPSEELRKWFDHDPAKWDAFSTQYRQELQSNTKAVEELLVLINSHDQVTLVFAAKDEQHNNAVVLQKLLQE